jgi:hypothetical protein
MSVNLSDWGYSENESQAFCEERRTTPPIPILNKIGKCTELSIFVFLGHAT